MTPEEKAKITSDLEAKCAEAVEAIHEFTEAMQGFTETMRKCL